MEKQLPKLAYSFEQACDAIGLGKTALYNAINRGDLISFKVGRRRMISAKVLQGYVDALESAHSSKPNAHSRFGKPGRTR